MKIEIEACMPWRYSARLVAALAFAAFFHGCGGHDTGENEVSAPESPKAEVGESTESEVALDAISDIASMKGMEYSKRAPIENFSGEIVLSPCQARLAARLVEFYVSRDSKNTPNVWDCCTLLDKNGESIKGRGALLFHAEKVAGGLYLISSSLRDDPKAEKNFAFLLTDGITLRRIIEFSSMPEAKTMSMIARATTDSAALNDLAAFIFNGEEKCRAADKAYCEKLLQRAALDGEWMACRNLAFLYKLEGEKDRCAYWANLSEKVFQRSVPGEHRKPMKFQNASVWPIMSEALGF